MMPNSSTLTFTKMHETAWIHIHTALLSFCSVHLKQVWSGLEGNVGSQSLWFPSQQSLFTMFSHQSTLSLPFSIHLQ